MGTGLAHWLGRPGSGAVLLVVALAGLVLAVDLRTGTVVRAAAAALARARQPEPPRRTRTFREPGVERVAELAGVPAPLPFHAPDAGAVPDAFFPDLERPALEVPPESEALDAETEVEGPVFPREFEGTAAPPAALGPVPEVAISHATDQPAESEEKVWLLPTTALLDTITGKRERLAAEVRVTGDTIVSTLQSFGIETRILGANSGPTVTQYELQPAVGVPVRRILGYQTDLALALAAPIRIQPFIPGKSAIGVEVPNKAAQLVSLKEIAESPAFADPRNRLSVALGADVSGHPVVGDLARMPHLLIAGATGSGKSVCINAMLGGFMLQATPAQLKLILIDPKRVELSNFADLPHLLVPVVVEPESAVASLRWAVKEMEERYKLFASHGARNIAVFNERAPGLGVNPLPYVVIVVDELADLMMVAAGEIEDLICRIAQLARAVGIHLVVATQRPSADIITGLIKANIPSRVAFAVSSGVDSRVILDEMGAEKLLGRGDMLYLPIDEGKPRRL
ncbi:MAG: DNA translocase FtsK, partial [Candidatus Dormibacteraeota bacterium]|nr:DNA translocase FtsK [Candidatus Dormibacteraeota bacterium]